MGKTLAVFIALGILAFPILFWLGCLSLTVYGVLLAFKASVVLGVIVLLVQPSPFILGVVGLFGHPEVAQKIANWMGV